jgi:tetratricopeptide (TPR) repeat protein
MRFAQVALFTWAALSCALATGAQNTQPDYAGQPAIIPNMRPNMRPRTQPHAPADESCLPWVRAALMQATVSTTELGVPPKARNDYKRACGQLKRKRLADAEESVRDAIQEYRNYSAAWVMLGELLEAKQALAEAQSACAQAQKTDPAYLPSYLCLAELGIKSEQWDEVLNPTKTALDLNSASDAYAYFYRAVAYLHLNNLRDAEANALEAVKIDKTHHETPSRALLSQIYEAEGNSAAFPSECKNP